MAKAKVHGNLPEKILQERPFADALGDPDFGTTPVHVWCNGCVIEKDQ